MPDQLTDGQFVYWVVLLIIGFVVILAVVALLSLLVALVKGIDRGVGQVRDTLGATSENTANTALITETGDRVDLVLAEGLAHHLFLGRVATGNTPATDEAGKVSP